MIQSPLRAPVTQWKSVHFLRGRRVGGGGGGGLFGGIWRVSPVEYEDPLFSRIFLGSQPPSPLYPKIK